MMRHVPFAEAWGGCDWLARNRRPLGHGNYSPALTVLAHLLDLPAHVPFSSVNVLFFSDGRPSDKGTSVNERLSQMTMQACAPSLSRLHTSHFKLHTVGLGTVGDHAVLKAMADILPGGCGQFHLSELSLGRLKSTITAFSASVTQTRLTSTVGVGGSERRLRPVQWDAQAREWLTYKGVVRLHAPPSFETAWERESEVLTLLVSRCAFDGGGERNVFHAQFEGSSFDWVAKESKHIDPGGFDAEVEFHKRSLVTQSTCAAWAGEFNQEIDRLGLGTGFGIPAVEVNRCYLVVVDARPLFVEPKLKGKFHKWSEYTISSPPHRPLWLSRLDCHEPRHMHMHVPAVRACLLATARLAHPETATADSNHGVVHRCELVAHENAQIAADYAVAVDVAEENDVPTADAVPQCFTHWTYEASRRTRMVCDLQGFFTGGRFVLVDPVIHSDGHVQQQQRGQHCSPCGEQHRVGGTFGRTDRGAKGMTDFLASHECNALCRALKLTQPTFDSVPSRRICVICEDQPREVRFGCGHACTCTSCAELIRAKDNLCPTCRAPLGDAAFKPVGKELTTYVRG